MYAARTEPDDCDDERWFEDEEFDDINKEKRRQRRERENGRLVSEKQSLSHMVK